MRNTTILLLLLTLTGCSSILGNKKKQSGEESTEKVASQQTAQVVREAVSTPPITVGNVGESASVNFTVSPSQQKVETETGSKAQVSRDESWFSNSTVRLPISIALVIGGIGILILTFAIRYAIKAAKATNAGNAVLTLSDDIIARSIQSMRTLATVTTDPTITAHANGVIAEMESNRGKLARKK